MDELCKKLEEAVICANDVQSHPEAVNRCNDAIAFINNIRSDPSNWKVAFQTFLMTTNFRVMFACLDIVVSFIREGFYQQVSSEEKNHLHTNLLNWLCNKSSDFINNIPDYLKTKYAVLVALVIKVDYPQDWPDAFDSLMNIRSFSSSHLLMYLKVLYYVDEEVVQGVGGKRAPSDRENLQAGTRVKDCLRDSSIVTIFNSWMEVLQQYGNQNDAMSVTLCNTCLETLSGYADWIDISFMTNPLTLQILFGLLENENYAENVLLCFEELINKGMPVQNKIRLIHSLTIYILFHFPFFICFSLFVRSVLGNLITSEKYMDNVDVITEILDVLMIIVKELVEALPQCLNLPDCLELIQYVREDFTTIFSILPTVLHTEYLNPILSISDLLTKIAVQMQREAVLEEKNDSTYQLLSLNLKQYLRMLLEGIFYQMKLPEDYAFDPDSGIDTDTDMYRMSLKKVLISLIKLYPDVYLDFLNYLFAEVTPFDHFQVAEWRDAEAALSYVYFFGDGCNVNYQQSQYREIFIHILTSLIESNVIQHHYHHSVLLVGMDIISRYQILLIPMQSLHYPCLSIFMQGLNSNRNRIREKAVNLLSRFVAAMKEAIVPFQQGILEAVQRMIVIPTPQDCMRYSTEPNYFEPIYPLFYITSSIISGNWNSLSDIYGFYHNAFLSLFDNINSARQQLTNTNTDLYVLNSIGYNIGCIANMLKGICNNTSSALSTLEGDMKNEVICLLRLYLDIYPLTVSSHGSYLLYQLDGLIHRLVIVLKEDILVYTADICQVFSSLHSYRAMETCYSIINQIYASYKSKQDIYLDPLFYHLTECCYQDYEGDEEVIGKKQNMVCEYYDLLDTVISYSPHLLYSQHNAPYLSLYLSTLHQGLTTSTHMPVTKLCICCYRKLATVWFDNTLNIPDEVRTMLVNHLITEVIPFLFQLYQLPQFNINDSGTITAINEIASLLFILDKNRPDFDQFFFNVFLPNNGCSTEICNDFRNCFQQKRNDTTCTYLRSFFKQLVR